MKELDSFTVERLEKWIAAGEAAKDHHDGVRVAGEYLAALARIALAAKSGDLFIGMDVGVDVSTCEADALNRYYGTVTEVSELETKKNCVILLVQDAEPNFTTTPQLNSPVIPKGWKLVPAEITSAMRDAWDSAPNCHEDDDVNMCNAYRAMLAAAPEK